MPKKNRRPVANPFTIGTLGNLTRSAMETSSFNVLIAHLDWKDHRRKLAILHAEAARNNMLRGL